MRWTCTDWATLAASLAAALALVQLAGLILIAWWLDLRAAARHALLRDLLARDSISQYARLVNDLEAGHDSLDRARAHMACVARRIVAIDETVDATPAPAPETPP